jgi:hypothetical protein
MNKHTILFLAANPNGTDRLALDREARSIQVELERSGYRDCFEFVTRWAVEPLDVLRELRKLRPTAVHFSGHGSPGGLLFEGRDGQPCVVSVAALKHTFRAAGSSVKLVILNACYSEEQADALVDHVACVVGMSGANSDDAARSFAIGFYGGLGEGESVAAAYAQGCAAISLEGGQSEGEPPQLKTHSGIDPAQLVLGMRQPSITRSHAADIPAVRSGHLELVDASFDDSAQIMLDLKLVNRSASLIFVKRVDLHILEIYDIPLKTVPCEPRKLGELRSAMPPSAEYGLLLPRSEPPFVLHVQVSHVLKPDEADRFRIILFDHTYTPAILSMRVQIIHGSEDAKVASDEILCVAGYDEEDWHMEWAPTARLECIALAQGIRAKKKLMSKGLIHALNEMCSKST